MAAEKTTIKDPVNPAEGNVKWDWAMAGAKQHVVVFAAAIPHHAVRLPDSGTLRANLLDYFRRAVPSSAFQLVGSTLDQISSGAAAGSCRGRPPTGAYGGNRD